MYIDTLWSTSVDSFWGSCQFKHTSRLLGPLNARSNILSLLASVFLLSGCSEEISLQSVPKIIDGYTIKVGNTTIRIHGIDAAEIRQECIDKNGKPYRCGLETKDDFAKLIKHGKLKCEVRVEDDYFRKVSVCYINDNDVGEWMVLQRGRSNQSWMESPPLTSWSILSRPDLIGNSNARRYKYGGLSHRRLLV